MIFFHSEFFLKHKWKGVHLCTRQHSLTERFTMSDFGDRLPLP